jgi:hypothetical protein
VALGLAGKDHVGSKLFSWLEKVGCERLVGLTTLGRRREGFRDI